MKVIPIQIIEGLRGKICSHAKMYMRQNRKNNKVFTGNLCNPFEGEASASQKAGRTKFKQAWAAVAAVFEDSAKLDEYRAAFEAQHKYTSLRGYIFAKEYEKL